MHTLIFIAALVHIDFDRGLLLAQDVNTNVPSPDPTVVSQQAEVQLPIDSSIPSIPFDMQKIAKAVYDLCVQTQCSKLADVQQQLDDANAELEKLRPVRELFLDADSRVSADADHDTGDLRASAFLWADVGHDNVLESSAEASYMGQQFVLRANLHAFGATPIDIQLFGPNPPVDEKIDSVATLFSLSTFGLGFTARVEVHGDVRADVGPFSASVETHGKVALILNIAWFGDLVLADDETRATTVARIDWNQWAGMYACADWTIDQALQMIGTDVPSDTTFSVGNTHCNLDTFPHW
jgi:hypothetical protein